MPRGCLFRCSGVLLLGVVALVILGLYIVREVTAGPSFDGEIFSVSGREIPISNAAAARLDAKLSSFTAGLVGGERQTLQITEEELNSKLALTLEETRAQNPDLPVEWAFVELQDGRAVAHARVTALGMGTTVSAPIQVRVVDRRPVADIGDVQVGNLPPIPGVSGAAADALEQAGLTETLERELPPVVDDVHIQEGRAIAVASP